MARKAAGRTFVDRRPDAHLGWRRSRRRGMEATLLYMGSCQRLPLLLVDGNHRSRSAPWLQTVAVYEGRSKLKASVGAQRTGPNPYGAARTPQGSRRGATLPPTNDWSSAMPLPSGLTTLRVLNSAVSLPSFTAGELAEEANVSPKSVENVLSRYKDYFRPVESKRMGVPGRPAARWAIRPERLSELNEMVAPISVGTDQESEATAEDEDLAEASLTLALNAVAKANSRDTDSLKMLLAAARSNLFNAGFSADGELLPGAMRPSRRHQTKAQLIAAVSDVLEARITDNAKRRDDAQVHAFRILEESKSEVAADSWLPLTNVALHAWGTLIAIPIVMPLPDWPFFNSLFPMLRRVRCDFVNTVCAVDDRIWPNMHEIPAVQPLAAVLHGWRSRMEDIADCEVEHRLAAARKVVVGRPHDDLLEAFREGVEHFVLAEDEYSDDAKCEIARKVAQVALIDSY